MDDIKKVRAKLLLDVEFSFKDDDEIEPNVGTLAYWVQSDLEDLGYEFWDDVKVIDNEINDVLRKVIEILEDN